MKHDIPSSSKEENTLHEVVIPRENAVFWMNGQGHWCNRHGRFEHKRIIDYFNRSIDHDKDGYFITQIRGDVREKVYFTYEETPLFVSRVNVRDGLRLILNTGEIIPLVPQELFVQADQLYIRKEKELIKFSERGLLEIARFLEEAPEGLMFRLEDRSYPIRNEETG